MSRTDSIVLVQLSDLHFGPEPVTKRWDPISGYRAHDFALSQALPEALESVVVDLDLTDDHPLHFIVSGDLTVSGTSAEFGVALGYLTGQVRIDPRDVGEWGIGSWARDHHRVPGNHDHWNGRKLLRSVRLQQAFNPDLFPKLFRRHAWGPETLQSPGLRLELCGGDTQSGFEKAQTNLRARGKLSPGHLRTLSARFKKSAGISIEPTVRALVLHHPIHSGRVPYMDLDADSCRSVAEHATAHRVGVLLVGHRHMLDAIPPHTGSDKLRRDFWELRAPSAFQGVAKDGAHGFLVHQVEPSADRPGWIRWTCHPYLWRADSKTFRCQLEDRIPFDLPAV